MTAFYNEVDNYAADWLENLIAAGHVAPGIVDRRPIQEIESYELAGFTQCHFFAGIGVWSGALRAAGWADDRPIWTGSCPCQPFSQAGKQKGFSDDRHLWPIWQKLIEQCKPAILVGEQVASALDWLDLVSTDLENTGYAFGAADLCAAGFDGAHIRQRLYFVGVYNTASPRCDGKRSRAKSQARDETWLCGPEFRREVSGLADDDDPRSQRRRLRGDSTGKCAVGQTSLVGGLADDDEQGSSGRRIPGSGESPSEGAGTAFERSTRFCEDNFADAPMLGRTPVDWLYCRDGKWRPVEPGTFPLVDETPARVGRLRAYGNALDFETAKNFCIAVKEIVDGV